MVVRADVLTIPLLWKRMILASHMLSNLRRADVTSHIQTVLFTDKEIAEIEEWCAEIREWLDAATFEDKQRCFTLLDVRGKLAVENNEKVAYIKCKIGKQRVSLVATSHSSNSQLDNTLQITVTARLVVKALKRHTHP